MTQVSISLDDATLTALQRLAQMERRSLSAMGAIIIAQRLVRPHKAMIYYLIVGNNKVDISKVPNYPRYVLDWDFATFSISENADEIFLSDSIDDNYPPLVIIEGFLAPGMKEMQPTLYKNVENSLYRKVRDEDAIVFDGLEAEQVHEPERERRA